jgi:uncharacterized protein
LDEKVFKYFESCDEIWHAGDIGPIEVTDRLAAFKPLRAVWGNIDDHKARITFPEHNSFTLEGVDVLITHIAGRPYVYSPNVAAMLKANTPKLLVCGHSHILRIEFDKRLKMLYLNPGSAGVHGIHKTKTLVRFTLDDGNIKDMEVVELGPRAGG